MPSQQYGSDFLTRLVMPTNKKYLPYPWKWKINLTDQSYTPIEGSASYFQSLRQVPGNYRLVTSNGSGGFAETA